MIWATNRTLCAAEPRRKEQWHHKRLTLWVSRSLWRAWVGGGLLQALNAAVWQLCMGPFEGGAIIWITSTTVWSQVKQGGKGTQPHPSTENWIKDLLSMAPPIRTRLSFPHSQSLPSGSFHKALILSFRGQTEWKRQSQKTNQTDSSVVSDFLRPSGL